MILIGIAVVLMAITNCIMMYKMFGIEEDISVLFQCVYVLMMKNNIDTSGVFEEED